VVQSREDVLLLPERLVTFTEGQASVEVPGAREDDPPVKKDVAVGLSDALNIEVTEGLSEGDLVIERPPKQIS
jgi:hypothetical protein